jgi:hypothetical protein
VEASYGLGFGFEWRLLLPEADGVGRAPGQLTSVYIEGESQKAMLPGSTTMSDSDGLRLAEITSDEVTTVVALFQILLIVLPLEAREVPRFA